MPIKIKKPELKTGEKIFLISSAVTTVVAVGFCISLFTCMNKIITENGKDLTTLVFSLLAAYFVTSAVSIVFGVRAYSKEDCLSALGKSIIYFAACVACLLNVRYGLVLMCTAYGKEKLAAKFIGSDGLRALIDAQYIPWFCLLMSLVFTFTIGIFSIVKLIRKK